jgi:hypothetical protein
MTTYHVEVCDWDYEGWQPCSRSDLYEDSGDDNDLLKPAVFTSKIKAQEFIEVFLGLMHGPCAAECRELSKIRIIEKEAECLAKN